MVLFSFIGNGSYAFLVLLYLEKHYPKKNDR